MKEIFNDLSNKINKDISKLLFLYGGNKINEELNLYDILNQIDKKNKEVKILVVNTNTTIIKDNIKESNEIICPICLNNCFININDYKFCLSDCKDNHFINNISLEDYINFQKIDLSQIICEQCNKNNKNNSYNYEFYKCNSCKKNLCALCKSVHDKNHKIINYDNKNYICTAHNGSFIKYCFDCKINMCIQCEKNHNNHSTIYLGDLLPDKDTYLNKIKKLKQKTEILNENIKNIIKILNSTIDNMNLYCKVSDNIINKYDINTINYQLLTNIETFNTFNDIIIKDIDNILNENNLENKFRNIMNLFNNYEQNPLNKKLDCYSTVNLDAPISTILLLKNKNDIAVCMGNGFLKIYETKTIQQKLSAEIMKNRTILDVIEFKPNRLCIACWDNNIRVLTLLNNNTKYRIDQILEGHTGFVNCLKILSFYKNDITFASSANDKKIILWSYQNKAFNKYKEINLLSNELINENTVIQFESIEESIKYKKIICGYSVLKKIYFCDLNDNSTIDSMNIKVNRCIRSLKIIEGDFLIAAGNFKIFLIDIKNRTIISSLKFGNNEYNCIFIKENKNILISQFGEKNRVNEFKFDNKNLCLTLINRIEKNDFTAYITTITELDNEHLIIGGYNNKINFFK